MHQNKAPVRPRPRTSLETTAAILAAAEAEFAAHGLEGARLERIAQGAGITKQLIHYYFGSKERLYTHLLKVLAELPDHDHILIDYDAMAPRAAMRRLFGAIFDLYRDNPNLARFTLDQNLHAARHVTARNRHRRLVPELIQKLDGILRRGVEAGAFRGDQDAAKLFAAGVSVMTACFHNQAMFSVALSDGYRPAPCDESWRAYAIEFIERSVSAGPPRLSAEAVSDA